MCVCVCVCVFVCLEYATFTIFYIINATQMTMTI